MPYCFLVLQLSQKFWLSASCQAGCQQPRYQLPLATSELISLFFYNGLAYNPYTTTSSDCFPFGNRLTSCVSSYCRYPRAVPLVTCVLPRPSTAFHGLPQHKCRPHDQRRHVITCPVSHAFQRRSIGFDRSSREKHAAMDSVPLFLSNLDPDRLSIDGPTAQKHCIIATLELRPVTRHYSVLAAVSHARRGDAAAHRGTGSGDRTGIDIPRWNLRRTRI